MRYPLGIYSVSTRRLIEGEVVKGRRKKQSFLHM